MSMSYYGTPPTSDEIMHFGVKGMKWGVRRKKYYMDDGSYTRLGKMRAKKKSGEMSRSEYKKAKKRYKDDVRRQWEKINDTSDRYENAFWGKGTNKFIAENMVNRKMSRSDATKAGRKKAVKVALGSALGSLGANYLLNNAPRWYMNGRIAMTNHNTANDAYARAMGLNEVKSKRPTLGIKQLRRGIKLTNAAMKRGKTRPYR